MTFQQQSKGKNAVWKEIITETVREKIEDNHRQ